MAIGSELHSSVLRRNRFRDVMKIICALKTMQERGPEITEHPR
jgi:hypothetical protein